MTLVEVDVKQQQVDSLREVAIREAASVENSARDAVAHAITCGEALIAVRAMLPRGSWLQWLDENFPYHQATASEYMRIAKYRDHVPHTAATIGEARNSLQHLGLPAINPSSVPDRRVDALVSEARLLMDEGTSLNQAAIAVGLPYNTLRRRIDPVRYEAFLVRERANRKRERAERQRLKKLQEQQARRDAIKNAGGDIAKAYEHVRKALEALESCKSSPSVNEAIRCGHLMEDAIAEAVRGYAE